MERWLREKCHGEMSYIERHFDLRVDPSKLVPGAKIVIVISLNYYPEQELDQEHYKLSKYAHGRDYHKVIRKI